MKQENRYPKLAIVSGGFDPVHVGHVRMIQDCKLKLNADYVFVILNSDEFLKQKKGFVFMPYKEREEIMSSLRFVDEVVKCIDKDQTVCETLRNLKRKVDCFNEFDVYFVNGGDRTSKNIPEIEVCKKMGITPIFGIGGKKIQSSSELAKKCKNEQLRKS